MTYFIPNLHPDWITHRLPTAADADDDGDVRIPLSVDAAMNCPEHSLIKLSLTELDWAWVHHGLIVPGQPWWSKKAAANPTPPATSPAPAPTRKVVQIEVTAESKNCYSCLYALCNDDSIFEIAFRPGIPDVWRQLPPIPQSE
jgi:hypothetical protein